MSDTPITDMAGDNPPETWVKAEAERQHQALMQANQALMQEILAKGAGIDQGVMLKMRVDFLTQFVLGNNEEMAYAFAIGWEQFLNAVLQQAAEQARVASLTIASTVPPLDANGNPPMAGQLHIPGA